MALAALCATPSHATQTDIPGPPGSVSFGSSAVALPNGNIAVADPDFGPNSAGAVYLYTSSGTLLSTLTGSSANDHIGDHGIVSLGNGNFVVLSRQWSDGTHVGAVTWVDGNNGLPATVSATNSLVGTANAELVVLTNGNYLISDYSWNGVGAVAWAPGSSGLTGVISPLNALTETSSSVFAYALKNGNYLVQSFNWNGGAGAVTLGDGSNGTFGPVSASNSLVGSTSSDEIGDSSVVELTNGNLVVVSQRWNGVGAVTWVDASVGTSGYVTAANSLQGHCTSAVALTNGNYVVGCPYFNNSAGAAVWRDGTVPTSGSISAGNALVGATAGDFVGDRLLALSNGNYVVATEFWNSGFGAVALGNGASGTVGTVSAANSLVGSSTSDNIASNNMVALSNGNFVVSSPKWNGNVGAATWSSGVVGATGVVSSTNSLVGGSAGDSIGLVTALTNGNYVVSSPAWNGSRGIATLGNGDVGTFGTINSASSLIGANASDAVGRAIIPLANGNFVVDSYTWNGNRGAVTWSSGTTPATGVVSASNSLVGTSAGDYVGRVLASSLPGWSGVTPSSDGYYTIESEYWTGDRGAYTLANGAYPLIGTIQAWNSVTGTAPGNAWRLVRDYDAALKRLVVGRPADNLVTILTISDTIFASPFE